MIGDEPWSYTEYLQRIDQEPTPAEIQSSILFFLSTVLIIVCTILYLVKPLYAALFAVLFLCGIIMFILIALIHAMYSHGTD